MKKIVSVVMLIILSVSTLSGCNYFYRSLTTDDGFKYKLDPPNQDAYIIEFPLVDEIFVPEYISGVRVAGLGFYNVNMFMHEETPFVTSMAKKLTIQHGFTIFYNDLQNSVFPYCIFPNLETIVYMDILYIKYSFGDMDFFSDNGWIWEKTNSTAKCIGYRIGHNNYLVELRKSDRELEIESIRTIKYIEIYENVKVIEAEVFDGLEGTIIRTSYESKPEGWEDGWNGNCQVEWGVNLD